MPSTLQYFLAACSAMLAVASLQAAAMPDVQEARDLFYQLQALRSANQVWMSRTEQAAIESYLNPGDVMLEWGSGYLPHTGAAYRFSTLWYSQFTAAYYSIEHDEAWYSLIRPNITSRPSVRAYHLAAVAPGHNGWGGGFEEGDLSQFRDYVQAVDKLGVPKFDKVLIDGRARAECAEYVLPFLKPDSIVFIHDFVGRAHYHDVVRKLYDQKGLVLSGQSLVIASPKESALKMQRAV